MFQNILYGTSIPLSRSSCLQIFVYTSFQLIQALIPLKNVLHGSDGPALGLDDPSLNLALEIALPPSCMWNPKQEFRASSVQILIRFSTMPRKIDCTLRYRRSRRYLWLTWRLYLRNSTFLRCKYDLNTLNVTRAFNKNSVFWSLLSEADSLPARQGRDHHRLSISKDWNPANVLCLPRKIFDKQQDIIQNQGRAAQHQSHSPFLSIKRKSLNFKSMYILDTRRGQSGSDDIYNI
jgi:hypothetical protein